MDEEAKIIIHICAIKLYVTSAINMGIYQTRADLMLEKLVEMTRDRMPKIITKEKL